MLLPLDLRVKKTRAIRRRLTKEQVGFSWTGNCSSVMMVMLACDSCFIGNCNCRSTSQPDAVQAVLTCLRCADAATCRLVLLVHGSHCSGTFSPHARNCMQANKKTEKQQKKLKAFPQRKFAVKA